MVQRRLATVLACDVVAYTRLMARDDEGTMAHFATHLALIRDLVDQHRGRPFGAAGDSVYAEFASPVEAVRCAVDVQLALHDIESARPEGERMRWRIGINLGDVMADAGALAGDGVNVAARLEALARPGGVCLSASVVDHVRDHIQLEFEDLGRQRLKHVARPVQAFRIPLPSDLESLPPYRGLMPFEPGEAAMFHGRTRAIAETVERLSRRAAEGVAFLLVYGSSGVGKSSLVRAGLFPLLTRPGTVAEVDRWLFAAMRPAAAPTPLAALCSGLSAPDALGGCGMAAGEVEALVDGLAEGSSDAVTKLRTGLGPGRPRLLLLVDQLEELLAGSGPGEQARTAFVDALAAMASSGVVWIAATMRSDFYHRCSEVPGLAALKDGWGSYELLPPSPAEIGQIIREPARRAGVQFEHSRDEGRLDDVLHHDATRNRVPLPLLSFALAGLCAAAGEQRRLTFADYRTLGGFEGAIAKRAEEVVRDLPPAVGGALPATIRCLVTLGSGGAVTGRAASYAEAASTPERSILVDALVAARLLVIDHGHGGGANVRLAHESLLTHWPRARDQVQHDREMLGIRTVLEAELERFDGEGGTPDLLLPPGRRLAEAEYLLTQRRDELPPPMIAFVEASRAARDRTARRSLNRLRALATGLALLAVVAGWTAWSATTARREADQARLVAAQAMEHAASERDRAEMAKSRLLARRAIEAIQDAQPGLGLALALQAVPRATAQPALGPDTHEAGVALLEALATQWRLAVLGVDGGAMRDATFSPDGRLAATGGEDRLVRIWEVAGGSLVATLPKAAADIRALAFDPQGHQIAGAVWDNTVRIWNIADGVETHVMAGHTEQPSSIAYSPDGSRIVTASQDGSARLWDAGTGTALAVMQSDDGFVWSAQFDPAGQRIVTAHENGRVRFWDAWTGTRLDEFTAHARRVWWAGFSPDGSRLLTTSQDGTARVWDAANLDRLAELTGHSDWVMSGAFSPDGRRIATSSADRTVRLWDTATGAALGVIKGHQHRVGSVEFSPTSDRLLTASLDGTAQIWDVAGWQLPFAALATGPVTAMALSPDEALLATGSGAGVVTLWDVASGAMLRRAEAGPTLIRAVGIDRAGRVLSAGEDGRARLWGGKDDAALVEIGSGAPLRSAALDAAKSLAALGLVDGGIELWSLVDGSLVRELRGHDGAVGALGFLPDPPRLASAGEDGTVRTWDIATGEELTRVVVAGPATLPAIGGDADLVAWVVAGQGLKLLDLSVADDPTAVDLPIPGISALAISRAPRRLVAGLGSGTILLVEAGSGGELGLFRGGGGQVELTALGEDGEIVAGAFADGKVRLWHAPPWKGFADLIAHAQAILPRGLTEDERRDPLLDGP